MVYNDIMKEKQLEIIQKYNPCYDNLHTWIRTVDDIKTFGETLLDPDYRDYEEFCPDYTKADAKKALETGYIMVFSSFPIRQGVFVTPSKMEALSYASKGRVYSKYVSLTDIAWIDVTQGQYANINLETWRTHEERKKKETKRTETY